MYEIQALLEAAIAEKASDLHLTVGMPPLLRINGGLIRWGEEILLPDTIRPLIWGLIPPEQQEVLDAKGEVDFSYGLKGRGRFRINVYRQRRSLCAALRAIPYFIPTLDELEMPPVLKNFALKDRGLFLVTGPTGSGKSTTLAAMINHINKNRSCHIITIEDPIEYLHKHGTSMINQREVGDDTLSFSNALRASLREDPDVILVGEMRDLDTIGTAITAAETGHFVLSTLHTTSASQTIDRIVDAFSSHQQQQIRIQLAMSLQGVISQRLLRKADGTGRVAAVEIMLANDAVRNLIRDGKTHQLDTIMQTNIKNGMVPLDYSLAQLVKSGVVTREDAVFNCNSTDMLRNYLAGLNTD